MSNYAQLEFKPGTVAQKQNADGLSDTVIHQQQKVDANMRNYDGQGYDGASVVSFIHVLFVLTEFRRKSPRKLVQRWPTTFTAFATG